MFKSVKNVNQEFMYMIFSRFFLHFYLELGTNYYIVQSAAVSAGHPQAMPCVFL